MGAQASSIIDSIGGLVGGIAGAAKGAAGAGAGAAAGAGAGAAGAASAGAGAAAKGAVGTAAAVKRSLDLVEVARANEYPANFGLLCTLGLFGLVFFGLFLHERRRNTRLMQAYGPGMVQIA